MNCTILTGATCYESLLRFPTDIKLLWECCEWFHQLTVRTCRSLKERQPRNKYHDVAKTRLAYASNANRSYCTENGITTSFARKGLRLKEDENKAVRRIIPNRSLEKRYV